MGKYKFTCWHCRTGMVERLPWKCPECGRLLIREVRDSKKGRSNAAHPSYIYGVPGARERLLRETTQAQSQSRRLGDVHVPWRSGDYSRTV